MNIKRHRMMMMMMIAPPVRLMRHSWYSTVLHVEILLQTVQPYLCVAGYLATYTYVPTLRTWYSTVVVIAIYQTVKSTYVATRLDIGMYSYYVKALLCLGKKKDAAENVKCARTYVKDIK